MCVTYAFAFEQAAGFERWKEVMKIFFFVHVCASLLHTRRQVDALVWVIVVSVGFFGVKGGVYTLLSGGSGRVYGPPGESYVSDNNSIPVALIMVIPLMIYLRGVAKSVWVRQGFIVAMLLCGMAILGSFSRGALLAVFAMLFFIWLKSSKKILLGAFMVALVPVAIGFMPEAWTDRMNTIETYEQDTSAMGRINSWMAAINIANDRPLVGGGFELYTPRTFSKYAPDPNAVHSAHSIYFQMLGEHGYVGLLIFLGIGISAWSHARRTIALARGRPELAWAAQLARALQVSLLGFAVGGAFVNISYWELVYYEIILLPVICGLARAGRAEHVAATEQQRPLRMRAR
jgi:probable O-glycosylation ligase (exosortase A-associated)